MKNIKACAVGSFSFRTLLFPTETISPFSFVITAPNGPPSFLFIPFCAAFFANFIYSFILNAIPFSLCSGGTHRFEKELNFDKAKTYAKSGAYFVYVSIFK